MNKSINSLRNFKLNSVLKYLGLIFILIAFVIVSISFGPLAYEEIKYKFKKTSSDAEIVVSDLPNPTQSQNSDQPSKEDKQLDENKPQIVPIDKSFGIIIPKVDVNSIIVPSVDPFNEEEYQKALGEGVAHAKGTKFPGEGGNIFLFAHSTANYYDAKLYNSQFYLLDKINPGDKIFVVYKYKVYKYEVSTKRYVDPTDISVLTEESKTEQLTLMTCWPAGLPIRRLIVTATPIK